MTTDQKASLLTKEERIVCQRVGAAGEAPHSLRAQVLLALDEGLTQKQASEQANMTIGQVKYCVTLFRKWRVGMFPDELTAKPASAKPKPKPVAKRPVKPKPQPKPQPKPKPKLQPEPEASPEVVQVEATTAVDQPAAAEEEAPKKTKKDKKKKESKKDKKNKKEKTDKKGKKSKKSKKGKKSKKSKK